MRNSRSGVGEGLPPRVHFINEHRQRPKKSTFNTLMEGLMFGDEGRKREKKGQKEQGRKRERERTVPAAHWGRN